LQNASRILKTFKRGRISRRTAEIIELTSSKDSVILIVTLTHAAKNSKMLQLIIIDKIELAQNIMLTLFF